MEMLSCKIYIEVDYQKWQPIKLSRQGPQISHLLFVDDITLISKNTTNSINAINYTLKLFTKVSGLTINYTKSKIFFSKNNSTVDRETVIHSFQMTEGSTFGKYLGYPIFTKKTYNIRFSIPSR